MAFQALTDKQIADVRISAFAILVFGIAIAAAEGLAGRIWPLDTIWSEFDRDRQYEWLGLLLLVAILLPIFRTTGMNVGTMFGSPVRSLGDWWRLVAFSIAMYLIVVVLKTLVVVLEPYATGSLVQDAIAGSVRIAIESGAIGALPAGVLIGDASGIILAPVAEEVFFRGLLQRRLMQTQAPWVAISLSSICFAVAHDVSHFPIYALLGGLLLGALYRATGSLWACIVVHALANTWSFVGRLLDVQMNDLPMFGYLRPSVLLICSFAVLSAAVSIRVLQSFRKRSDRAA